ncbi:helix-turn-helix domain-containing protein, partial [Desulfovibrio oxamicus]
RTMAVAKRDAAREALRRHGGRVMAACRELGISKDTLRRILKGGGTD